MMGHFWRDSKVMSGFELLVMPRSKTPVFAMIWLLSCYCVLSDEVPPHFSTPLHAITRSVYSLHPLPISPLEAL
jgi:hypothetical protein